MGNHLINWLLVFGLVLQPGPSLAQKDITILPDSPFVENYSPKDYQSHNQVWSIAEDQRGVMIFGNGEGWLEFDGARFRHTNTKNTVFSMTVDHNNVVYIGLMNDFGRLLSDDRGKLVFESLAGGLSEHERKFNIVKQILATSQGIYFRTDSDLGFRWIDKRLEKTEIDVGRLLSQVGDHVFGYNDSGIHILQGNKLVALPQTQSLGGKNQVLRVLPYKERKLLIVTREKGLFLYSLGPKQGNSIIDLDQLRKLNGQRIQVFETPVADFLRQYDFDQAIRLTNGDYAFSTRKGGLIIMSPSGKILHVIDESNGLIDNYVYDIYQEKDGNLWVATNNGISYVEISSPLSRFDDGKQIGFTMTATRYRDRLFVGGFKGAFYHQGYDRQLNPKLVSINDITRTCLDMLVYQDKLLLGGHYALAVIEGTQVVDQIKIEDEVVFSMGTSLRFPQHVFVGFTDGFSVLTLKETVAYGNTQIRLLDKQQGDFRKIKGMIRKIISDPEGNLWLSDLSGQILYLRFRSDQVSDFDVYAYDHRHGLPETEFIMVHIIDGRLIVGTRSGIYTIKNMDLAQTDPASITFVLEDTFGRKPNKESIRVHRIHKDQNGRIWISSYNSVSTLTPRPDGSYEWNRERYKKIEGNVESMFFDENDIVWFASSIGLYRYDQKKEPKDVFDFRALISRVSVQNGHKLFQGVHCQTEVQTGGICKSPALLQNKAMIIDLPYEKNSLVFEYGATAYERPKLNRYSYRLEGYEEKWSDWTELSRKEYTSLREGAYTFRVKARNIYEHPSREASYAFRILPPWHRTLWAYAAYFAVAVGIFFVGFRIYAWRLLAAKRRLEGIVKERTAEVVRQKEEIVRTQKIALRHAHKAGMADIAINTIHNVGNLLNSAKVSLGLLSKCSNNSSAIRYQKADDLLQKNLHRLEDFICHDLSGRKLIEYYLELGKNLRDENKRVLEYIETIAKQHKLISNTIAAQGRYADGAEAIESETRLEELIQDVLTMEAESLNSKVIQVKTSYDLVPVMKIQYNKLIQVLINLIKNAVEALEENASKRILEISLTQAGQEILIRIEDNGHGIKESDLEKIFSQGFSTRSEDRGYGLHDCANFVTEMGGKLTVKSAGPGQGACFEIRLAPFAAPFAK